MTDKELLDTLMKDVSEVMRKIDTTCDGLGDWHDGTEYLEWARGELQQAYVKVIKARDAQS